MNKEQKNTPIRAVQIMKKEFFANRFGVKANALSWGIIVSQNEDSEKNLNAALLFKEDKNCDKKVDSIVQWLSSHGTSKTHSRHFDADICREKGLKITMLEDEQKLQDVVLTLHHAYMHTFSNTGASKIVENHLDTRMVFLEKS